MHNGHSNIFIIGNGLSRKNINVEVLKQHGAIIACNYAYKEFDPDYLVSIERNIQNEIDLSKWQGKTITKSDRSWRKDTIRVKADYPFSGYIALEFALSLKPKNIFFIGFDFGEKNSDSNIYTGHKHYTANHPITGWCDKINNRIKKHVDVNFYHVVDETHTREIIKHATNILYGEIKL